MGTHNDIGREKRLREIAETIYAENKKKGLPSNPMRDWKRAEQIYDDKIVYLFFWKPAQFLQKYYYKVIAVALSLIVFFAIADFKVQQDLKDMRNRPYLSLDLIDPVQITGADTANTYYGSYLILKNSGKTPATNVTVSYYMTTEVDGKKAGRPGWFSQRAQGASKLGFVPPGAFVKEPSFRSLSPEATLYYYEAVASYRGLNDGKHYWTQIKRMFKVDKGTKGLVQVYNYAEWDKDKDFEVPGLSTDKDIWELMSKAGKK